MQYLGIHIAVEEVHKVEVETKIQATAVKQI